MNIQFKKATRTKIALKLGISGPSGSGKTTAALHMARGLVGPEGRIAFLDTENGSASAYSNLTDFDVLDMNPPYLVAKFLAALEAAEQAGYHALVVDSASHAWTELLAKKEALDARGGNSYANWGSITKEWEQFLAAIRNARLHVICCLRSKQDHVQDKDANGKTTIRKVGFAPVARDGFEYELFTVFELAMDHHAKASKDRTGLFEGRLETITAATGRELAAWLASGGEPVAEEVAPPEFTRAAPIPEKEYGAKAGEVFQGMQEEILAAKAEPSRAASDFVDSIEPETSSRITLAEFAELTDLCIKNKVPIDKLQQYCMHHEGYLEGVTMNTLVRAKLGPLTTLISDPAKRRALMAALDNLTTTAA